MSISKEVLITESQLSIVPGPRQVSILEGPGNARHASMNAVSIVPS